MTLYNEQITEEPEAVEDEATSQCGRQGEATGTEDIPSWNEDEWAVAIKKYDPLRQANASLEKCLEAFLQQASDEDKRSLVSAQSDLKERIDAAKAHGDPEAVDLFGLSRRERILRKLKAPEYVAPVWGAIKIVLVLQINHMEIKENIQSSLEDIASKFEVLDHVTEFLPRANLVKAIGDAYASFSSFLCEVVKFYGESRTKKLLKDFSHPWKIRFEPLVLSIQGKIQHVRDIAQFHGLITGHVNYVLSRTNLALSKDAVELARDTNETLKAILSKMQDPHNQEQGIKFASTADISEIGSMVRQCVNEKLESAVKSCSSVTQTQTKSAEKSAETQDLLDVAKDLFPELQAETDVQKKISRQLESRDENEPVNRQRRNIFRVSHIMSWVESPTSRLLWVDGNNILDRANFATSFTAPLMIDAESNYGSCLFLKHFCGDSIPSKNSYNVLLQALLFQMLQQRPSYYENKRPSITRDRTANADDLWKLLVECLEEIDSDCTFIVIGGIDRVYSEGSSSITNQIVQRFENLVKSGSKLVKVLLTARLSKINVASTNVSQALILASQHGGRRDTIYENEQLLTPYKFVEMQERKSKNCTFNELIGLYTPGTTIFTKEEGDLRAFVVQEIDGMHPIPFGRSTPLLIKAFYIDHDGKRFVRKRRQYSIQYFAGIAAIKDLRQVPAGYLEDEHKERAYLLERGKKFWMWSHGVHYKWHPEGPGQRGSCTILDQSVAVMGNTDQALEEVSIKDRSIEDVKPLTLMLCPPSIMGFSMLHLSWRAVKLSDLNNFRFDPSRLQKSMINKDIWNRLLANILLGLKMTSGTNAGGIWSNSDSVTARVSHGGFKALLHGKPGSGKRTLVYALSHAVDRPVMEIARAYIGVSVEKFETQLTTLLRYAELWECIVLYRGKDDDLSEMLKETVLGSILTRKLETFNGTLIMVAEWTYGLDEISKDIFTVIAHIEKPSEKIIVRMWTQFLREIVSSGVVTVSEDLGAGSFDGERAPNYVPLGLSEVLKKNPNMNFSGQAIKNILRCAIARARFQGVQLDQDILEQEMAHRKS